MRYFKANQTPTMMSLMTRKYMENAREQHIMGKLIEQEFAFMLNETLLPSVSFKEEFLILEFNLGQP
jgi:hypothetical protein